MRQVRLTAEIYVHQTVKTTTNDSDLISAASDTVDLVKICLIGNVVLVWHVSDGLILVDLP